ncbi:hypothetical protein [Sodalis sp.]
MLALLDALLMAAGRHLSFAMGGNVAMMQCTLAPIAYYRRPNARRRG